jgi:hypothetical protein
MYEGIDTVNMGDDERDTSRAVVRTYVPAYQRDEWDDHADDLGMSRSEFVRTMVQAGRRGFEGVEKQPVAGRGEPQAEASESSTGGTLDVRGAVKQTLSASDFTDWEELRDAVAGDIETRLEETLQELQSENTVRYSGRNGGYTLDE